MDLYYALENLHSTVKHFGVDKVDPNELRRILRQAQVLTTVLLNHEVLSVRKDGGLWECNIVTQFDDETKDALFRLLSD